MSVHWCAWSWFIYAIVSYDAYTCQHDSTYHFLPSYLQSWPSEVQSRGTRCASLPRASQRPETTRTHTSAAAWDCPSNSRISNRGIAILLSCSQLSENLHCDPCCHRWCTLNRAKCPFDLWPNHLSKLPSTHHGTFTNPIEKSCHLFTTTKSDGCRIQRRTKVQKPQLCSRGRSCQRFVRGTDSGDLVNLEGMGAWQGCVFTYIAIHVTVVSWDYKEVLWCWACPVRRSDWPW